VSQHSKASIKVTASSGDTWTTRRGARRLVSRGLADELPNGTLQMHEQDHRYQCEPAAAQGPQLEVIAPRAAPMVHLEGFLPYPQATQTTAARGLRGKYPGLADHQVGCREAA